MIKKHTKIIKMFALTLTVALLFGTVAASALAAPSKPSIGSVTILNTIANTARRTNDVIWDTSKTRYARGYEILCEGENARQSRQVGRTNRGTLYGMKIRGLYKIRVRTTNGDQFFAFSSNYSDYGPWSKPVYRYFHTTEKIRLKATSKGAFTISWANNSEATGYQVMYSTNKNGAGAAKNITTISRGKKSFTKTGLKRGTYYVQIRELKKVGSITYIGNVSCPVAVKVW